VTITATTADDNRRGYLVIAARVPGELRWHWRCRECPQLAAFGQRQSHARGKAACKLCDFSKKCFTNRL